MVWIIPLILLILLELAADIFSKEWSLHNTAPKFIAALSAYLVANIFWLFALKYGSGLARGAVIFSVVSAVLALIIGIGFYKESITHIQLTGLLLGIVAIILIFWPA